VFKAWYVRDHILLSSVIISWTRWVWVHRGLRTHSTLYRLFHGWFLQARWPNQQSQSTEENQLATEISLNHTRITLPCYNINCRQPPLGWAQRMGPSVTKTQFAGPISCLEHRATTVLHCTIVTRAAVLMFPFYSRPSALIRWGHGGWVVPGLVTFSDIWPGDGEGLFYSILSPRTHTGAWKKWQNAFMMRPCLCMCDEHVCMSYTLYVAVRQCKCYSKHVWCTWMAHMYHRVNT